MFDAGVSALESCQRRRAGIDSPNAVTTARMKRLILVTALLGVLPLGCDDSGAAQPDAAASGPASGATASGAPAKGGATAPSGKAGSPDPSGPKTLDHDQVLAQAAKLEGQVVIVNAVSWGVSKRGDGGVQVNLGKEKLSGMKQAKLVAFFPKGAEADRFKGLETGVAKDAAITLICKVGEKAYGARRLLECMVKPAG